MRAERPVLLHHGVEMYEPDDPETRYAEDGRTQIRTLSRARQDRPAAQDWVHCLRVVEGEAAGRRLRVAEQPIDIGRRAPCTLVLPDPEVSGVHCSVRVPLGQTMLEVVDRQSTNGCFVDGRPVLQSARLRVGGLLQLGHHVLVHEHLPRAELEAAEAREADLARAAHYVKALLPPPMVQGPVRTDWFYQPSAQVGGDAFGHLVLDANHIAGYVIDVAGHGAGAALHTVAVMNTLRQRALPDTDFADPAHVLSRLNEAFAMDTHDGLCFTMWYGVYDIARRRLRYSAGGHHAACLAVPGEAALRQLHTPGLVVGALEGAPYRNAETEVPPESRLYLFSDGLFELVDTRGRQWTYADVLPFIAGSAPGEGEAARLAGQVRHAAGARTLDDDCSVVVVTFSS